MGRGRIRITAELLRAWMPLPITAEVIGSVASPARGMIVIDVEDPALPGAAEGEEPAAICPTFRSNPPVEFVDWGVRK